MCTKLLQSFPTLCDPTDCSPPGFFVHGILQARIRSGLPLPLPGDLPNPGIEFTSFMSPTLTGGSFTTSTVSLVLYEVILCIKLLQLGWLLTVANFKFFLLSYLLDILFLLIPRWCTVFQVLYHGFILFDCIVKIIYITFVSKLIENVVHEFLVLPSNFVFILGFLISVPWLSLPLFKSSLFLF